MSDSAARRAAKDVNTTTELARVRELSSVATKASSDADLFVASLAGCVGFYGRRYLARHGLCADESGG